MASKLQTEIKDWLKPRCEWVFVVTAGRIPVRGKHYQMAPNGFPDIMAMTKRGKLIFIEVKRAKEKLRPQQFLFLAKMAGFGCFAITARSLEDVERALEGVLSAPQD